MVMTRQFPRLLRAVFCIVTLLSAGRIAVAIDSNELGRQAPSWSLDDYRGKKHHSSDLQNKKAVVVAFLGVECPLAKIYANRLNDIAQKYKDKGVSVIGINSNIQDSLAEIASFANRQSIDFTILKDPDARLASDFGATRTLKSSWSTNKE